MVINTVKLVIKATFIMHISPVKRSKPPLTALTEETCIRYLPAITHGGESRDLNDRVHVIGFTEFCAGIWTKQVNKLKTLFLIPIRFS